MSTTVRTTGWTASAALRHDSGARLAFRTSTNNPIIVVRDGNDSATGGRGDNSGTEKIYIYEQVTGTWNLRKTMTAPGGDLYSITASILPNNDIAIATLSLDQKTISYTKVVYSGFTGGTFETVATTTGTFQRFDLDTTDTAVPIVAALRVTTSGAQTISDIYCYVKRTSDSTWIATSLATNTYNDAYNKPACATIASLDVSSGSRRVVVASAYGSRNLQLASDSGVRLHTATVSESTGAFTNIALAATYAVGELNYGSYTEPLQTEARHAKLYRSDTNECTLAIMHSAKNRVQYFVRGTYAGAGTFTTLIAATTNTASETEAQIRDWGMATSYHEGSLNYYYIGTAPAGLGSAWHPVYYTARINESLQSIAWHGSFEWDNYKTGGWISGTESPAANLYVIAGGANRNFTVTGTHDTVLNAGASSVWTLYHHNQKITTVPTIRVPLNGSTVTDGNPSVSAFGLGDVYPQSKIKMIWQFATDSGFTSSVRNFFQADSKFQIPASYANTTRFDDSTLNAITPLAQGSWYARVYETDLANNVGTPSASSLFTVSHPPSATKLQPPNGVAYAFGDGTRQLSWDFSDPASGDYQTAYQVIVEKASDGTSVVDTGKVVSVNNSATVTISAALKGVGLRWKVRLWDRDDVVGAYSDYGTFSVDDPGVVTVTSPTSGGTVTSGIPYVQFNTNITNGRTIKSYQVVVTKGSTVIWNSGLVNGTWADDEVVTATADKTYYSNLNYYTVTVTVTDSVGMQATSTPVSFQVSYVVPTSPSSPIANIGSYNVEGSGYNSIAWSDTGRDSDFYAWNIYRRDDLIDADTNAVIQVGDFELIDKVYEINTSYSYKDYLAPSNYRVTYGITQAVNRFGDEVESAMVLSLPTFPKADGYWLVNPGFESTPGSTVKLYNVTADSFDDETEEEEYVVIGRGRHVDHGQKLGIKGSLTVQIRNSGTKTARQRRLELTEFKDESFEAYIRTPFGDIFYVNIGNLNIGRIAGVGTSEFCDVQIPYTEVSK